MSPMRRAGRSIVSPMVLGVVVVLSVGSPAQAHTPAADASSPPAGHEVTSVEQIGERAVEVSRHLDPAVTFTSGGRLSMPVAPSPGTGRSTARSLAQTCTPVNRGSDDSANAFHSSASRVLKVIYAYPTDVGNRLATYAPVIQSGTRLVVELVAGESGNRRSLRFDLGTSAGPGCVDIQTVALTGATSHYTSAPGQAFTLLRNELQPKVAGQTGSRNFLVYADGVTIPNVGGEAQIRTDDTVAGTNHGLGALWGILYGRGGTDFFGSNTAFPPGTTSRAHVDVALHEISHTLGAVQRSAPRHSTSWHCLDEWDILCYDDDGPGGLSTYAACSTSSSQLWDCNKDDYFNPTPPAGSYLATHWNLYNSAFMCTVAQCAPGGVQGPPAFPGILDSSPPDTKILRGPGKSSRDRTPTFTFSSSEQSASFECAYDTRGYVGCTSPVTLKKLSLGRHGFRVYAVDGSGNEDPTPAQRSFRLKPKR